MSCSTVLPWVSTTGEGLAFALLVEVLGKPEPGKLPGIPGAAPNLLKSGNPGLHREILVGLAGFSLSEGIYSCSIIFVLYACNSDKCHPFSDGQNRGVSSNSGWHARLLLVKLAAPVSRRE